MRDAHVGIEMAQTATVRAVNQKAGGGVRPVRRSEWPVGRALDEAYKAGRRYGDTGAFWVWVGKAGLAGRGELLLGRLEREFRRAVEREPQRELVYRGVRISQLPGGEWVTGIEPESRFEGLKEAKEFVDAVRRWNPVGLLTVIGAGAVQGVVQPYVTRHVYREPNPRRRILDEVMAEHIRMPGFPQMIVTRGFAWLYFRGLGWDELERGPGSLESMVMSARVVGEPLTDTGVRDYNLNLPNVLEGMRRNTGGGHAA